MEKMYNWEYIYRGDIYRMENGKGVLEEKNIDVAYMEDDHAWARINDILDCLYPFGLTDDKEKNEIAKIWKENDEKFQEESNEIYDIERVFKSRNKNYIKSELPTVVKKNWIEKIIEKVKRFFNK